MMSTNREHNVLRWTMKFLVALSVIFGVLLLSQPSRAVNVTEFDAISGSAGTRLHTSTPPTTSAIHISAYYCNSGPPCTPDGGEGLLVKDSTVGVHCTFPGGGGTGTPED